MKRSPLAVLAMMMFLVIYSGCEGDRSAASDGAGADAPRETVGIDQPEVEPAGDTLATLTASPQPNSSTRIASTPDEPLAASAFILIQDAAPTDPQLLLRQLQQVLPKTMVVKLAQSPNKRDVKLEVTNVKDLRALANKIPYGSVESVDDRTRTITVEY